jgi:hypothetical protein
VAPGTVHGESVAELKGGRPQQMRCPSDEGAEFNKKARRLGAGGRFFEWLPYQKNL